MDQVEEMVAKHEFAKELEKYGRTWIWESYF